MASSDDAESLLKEENRESLTLSAPAIQTEGQGISLMKFRNYLWNLQGVFYRLSSYYHSPSDTNTVKMPSFEQEVTKKYGFLFKEVFIRITPKRKDKQCINDYEGILY